MRIDALTRFRAMAPEGPPDACWVWKGNTDGDGYGKFYVNGRYVGAHRFAWEQANGPIPRGKMALHECDNRPCINPKHLYLGTQKENAADREKRGRGNHAAGDHHGSRTKPECRPRGSRNGRARLTRAMVQTMRARASAGESRAALARAYAVSWTQVDRVLKGAQWVEVDE